MKKSIGQPPPITSAREPLAQGIDLTDSFATFKKKDIEQSISDRFECTVECYPNRPAVKHGSVTLTYAELNREANYFAHRIVDIRGARSEAIAVLLPQGVALVAAILSILKAGKFYVALDPQYPISNLTSMLEDSQAGAIITDNKHIDLTNQLSVGKIDVVNVDTFEKKLGEGNLALPIPPDYPAYIFYTSGTTGHPKGVFDCHRNVLHNVMRYTNTLRISPDDRLTLLQSSSFSGSVSSLFGAILNGACVFPLNLHRQSSFQLAQWLQDEKITIYHSVPAIFRSIQPTNSLFPSIRVIRLEGDQASNLDVDLFRHHFSSRCILVNGLGTTETGLVRQYFVDQDTEVQEGILPVGFATQDMEVQILDQEQNPVPPGTIGEISVRSRYLALGYWRNEESTTDAFRPDPHDPELRIYLTGDIGRLRSDGVLEHLGRKEGQARIRGQTIELAIVEIALLKLQSISEAVVGSLHQENLGERIVAYYVPAKIPGPTVSSLRRDLLRELPEFAMPSVFIALESLPRNRNGKIDRKMLPQPGTSRPDLDIDYVHAQSLVQLQLIQIWEQEMRIHPIGIRDNLFDLGGDSLIVLNILLQVREIFNVEIPESALFPDATVEQLALLIQRQGKHLYKPAIRIRAGDSGSPLFFMHGDYNSGGFYCLKLARHLNKNIPFYVLPPYGIDGGLVPSSYEEMAIRHLADIQKIQRVGPYYLGGTCNGGMVAYEIARLLRSQGEEIALLAMFVASAENQRFRFLSLIVAALGSIFGYSREKQSSVFLRIREILVIFQSHTLMHKVLYIARKSVLIPKELVGLFRSTRKPLTSIVDKLDLATVYHTVDHLYVPEPYSGDVTLLWPTGESESANEAAAGWRRVADSVELHTLTSTHHCCLTEDVDLLAKELSVCYLRAKQTSSLSQVRTAK